MDRITLQRRRRQVLRVTIPQLAWAASIARERVSKPDARALARIEWVLWALEQGWSLAKIRSITERDIVRGKKPCAIRRCKPP